MSASTGNHSASTANHIEVGAHALGLLEAADQRAFEGHLAACRSCHEELAELRGLAAMLDGLPPIEMEASPPPEPDPRVVTDMLRDRARREHRGRVTRTLLGAAAGVVLLAGALGAGITLGSDRSDPPAPSDGGLEALFRDGRKVAATDPSTGVSGQVAIEPKAWGSRVGLKLSKVRGPLECQLVAVDKTGRHHAVAGWAVPAKGYGLPGSPAPLALQGGTALAPSQIVRFEVRTLADDRTLLRVPA